MPDEGEVIPLGEDVTSRAREAIGLAHILSKEDWRTPHYHLLVQLRDALDFVIKATEEASAAEEVGR